MRLALIRLAVAITTMVALSFLIPLAYLTSEVARQRAVAGAQQEADAMVAALVVGNNDAELLARAVTATPAGVDGRIALHLPGQPPIGVTHAPAADISGAAQRRESRTTVVTAGLVYLQAVVLEDDGAAVVEVFIPDAELRRGVNEAWFALALLALLLVAGSTLVADRIAARIVSATRQLAAGARAFGGGDLSARVAPDGPAELRDAARSFNAMADRMVAFADAERELAADLSHRLRTPLTVLRLDADALPPGPIGDRMRQAFDALDDEIEQIITGARRKVGDRAGDESDLVEVVADRLAFWSVLAEDQQRPWRVVGGQEPVLMPVPGSDLIAAVDCLLGNVFQHTPEGTAFQVFVSPDGLVVDDAGGGIADPEAALRRGQSGGNSTGLGLDIVNRVAAMAGGRVVITRSPLGGARVEMALDPRTMRSRQ